MDILARQSHRYPICNQHGMARDAGQVIYRLNTTRAAILLVCAQLLHAIIYAVHWWGTGTTADWNDFAAVWAIIWPTTYVTASVYYHWHFRRSRWTCRHQETKEDDNDRDANIYLFNGPSKFDNDDWFSTN